MKEIITWLMAVALLTFILGPWGLAVVDMFWYIVTGSQVSSFPWFSWRGLLAAVWPFVATGIIAMFAADR